MIFDTFPPSLPNTPLLDRVTTPVELRKLDADQLPELANQLREYLLYSVSQTGGHFGAGLGVIELTVALHYVFNTPEDNLIWDVGHQAYPHKILTGRKQEMLSIRQKGGLAAFPAREESIFDAFGVGHSSTSISAALGMAIASQAQGLNNKHIAVIGDGAMTAGMAFEALNHAAHERANILVILNDNEMSISHNVGGFNKYLSKVLSSKTYHSVRDGSKQLLKGMPSALSLAKKTETHVKGMIAPSTLFEELGFNYVGAVDGHDLSELVAVLENIKTFDGPQFLHVITKKGKGFLPAEADPIGYHAINKLEVSEAPPTSPPKYANVFGQWICDEAALDERLVAITPAMEAGSGLTAFAQQYPSRYHDVAIAEQHAVTLAAGLACAGAKPVVAIYSTFLQRAYDQLIHDVCVQNLDVLFAIDRAGLVGEDGPTHAGAFDISFLRCIPNLTLMAPADENEARQMLHTGYHHEGAVAVRYPRGRGVGKPIQENLENLPIGKAVKVTSTLEDGQPKLAILAFGSMVKVAEQIAAKLPATVINMRFIKPLDTLMITQMATSHDAIVTLEENVVMGGAGSAVLEVLMDAGLLLPVKRFGLPDAHVQHGTPAQMFEMCRLDVPSLLADIRAFLSKA